MYRPPTHPHRMMVRLDGGVRGYVRSAAEVDGVSMPVVLRAAILAALPLEVNGLALSRATTQTGRPAQGAGPLPRTGLRLCGACHGRIGSLATEHRVTLSVAARALIADGLKRDWSAHVGQAIQGDLWRP
jgi:hypothetical protein